MAQLYGQVSRPCQLHAVMAAFLGVLGILDQMSAKKKVEAAMRETAAPVKAIKETCPLAGMDKDLRVLL
jgi:energy-converting hydrogenase Eha subunit F